MTNKAVKFDQHAALFGHNVRRRRMELGLSQEQLAARLQRYPSRVSEIERGAFGPRLPTIAFLAKALDCSPLDLLRGVFDV